MTPSPLKKLEMRSVDYQEKCAGKFLEALLSAKRDGPPRAPYHAAPLELEICLGYVVL
jgi:hypothetical protein